MTEAQASAVECRDWTEEPAMRAAWHGDWLEFDVAARDTLAAEINDASNAEDAEAIELRRHGEGAAEMAKHAARAARALANLYLKVLKA